MRRLRNNLNKYKMTDRELLKEARDLIVMCSLLDKSNQCNDMVNRIDEQLSIPRVVRRSEQLVCSCKTEPQFRECTNFKCIRFIDSV